MKALELADKLEKSSWTDQGDPQTERESAAELRRLAEVNAELLGALEEAKVFLYHKCYGLTYVHSNAQKAIAKAKEQQ